MKRGLTLVLCGVLSACNGCSDKPPDRLVDPPPPVKNVWPELAALMFATKDLQPYLAVKKGSALKEAKKAPEKKVAAFRTAVSKFSNCEVPRSFQAKLQLVEAARAQATKLAANLPQKSADVSHLYESLRESLEKLR